MPVLNVTLLQGYDKSTRQALGEALTQAVQQVIVAAPEAIVVAFHELEPGNYFRGGQARNPGPPQVDPAQVVRLFLDAMQARDLDRARQYLAPDFSMVFPGDARMSSLEELVAFSKERYQFVTKTFESFDVSWQGPRAIVHCHGTLSGKDLQGVAFDGVRFIDRFEVMGGLLARQQVWNDLAIVLNKR